MSKSVKSPGKEEVKKPAEKIQQKEIAKGRTPKEIVKKHITDKDDVITDEDFREVIVGGKVPDDTAHTPLDLPAGKKRPKDEDKDPEIFTPWDILS